MMKFSIITINYNNKEGLKKTIESVIGQTCSDFEYIVIDGGSTDGSVEVIRQYSDRIDYWVSEPDNGVYNAMNKGILCAHGTYLNFMNSGDTFHSEYVLAEIMQMEGEPDIISGQTVNQSTGELWKEQVQDEDLVNRLMTQNLCHQSMFIKRVLFDRHKYREDLKLFSDWYFNFQTIINEGCSFVYTKNIVADYDMSGMSASASREVRGREHDVIFRDLLPELIYAKLSEQSEFQSFSKTRIYKRVNSLYHYSQFLCNIAFHLLVIFEWLCMLKFKIVKFFILYLKR